MTTCPCVEGRSIPAKQRKRVDLPDALRPTRRHTLSPPSERVLPTKERSMSCKAFSLLGTLEKSLSNKLISYLCVILFTVIDD
mmetsp:Transcript_18045/g.40797  ORF Transcript_18045/g.40797 Transcript_18045/m.40797 type:complete len:83 (+) Transcript_18045:223-471(+)